MMRALLAAALVPLALGDYSYDYTDAPTMSPTASMAPTRTETYAPTRMTEAPSYAPTSDTYAPTMAPTATRAPTTSSAPTVKPTLSPVKQIAFFSVSTDSAAAATLYNTAAVGEPVEFPNDPLLHNGPDASISRRGHQPRPLIAAISARSSRTQKSPLTQ